MNTRSFSRHTSIDFLPRLKPLAFACTAAMGLGAGTAQAQLEEVTVTGTRVQTTSGMNTPTPVTVVTSEELELMAPGNIIEALSQLPQFYSNTSAADPGGFFGTPGSGNLNLRGIGTRRTLVLLDGRRVVSSTRFGGTDISVFPEAMIRAVETVTGGASAAYGTDAVTGVSNFILDTDFTGIRAHAQSGTTSRSDNNNWEVSFAGGVEIGDRQHLLFSTDHYEQDGVFTYEGRDWYQGWGVINNPDASGPAELIRPQVVSTSATFDGLITAPGTPLHNLNFNSQGTAATPFVYSPTNGGRRQSIVGGGGSGDFIGADRPTVQAEFERESTFLYWDFDINDNVTMFLQGINGQSITTSNNLAGQFQAFFSPMTIYSGNAFLPASIQQVMTDNDIASFTLNRMGHSSDLATGGAGTVQDSRMLSKTIGFEVDLDNGWGIDAYYQDGETKTAARQLGGIRLDRIHLAHDAVIDPATGATVCNVTFVSGLYPDCVPLNTFGRGNMSDAAIGWVTGFDEGNLIETPLYYTQSGYDLGLTDSYISEAAKTVRSTINQEVFEVTLNGEFGEGRRTGPIGFAAGISYREESMNQIVRSPANPDGNLDDGRPVPANDAALGIRGQPGGDVNNSVAIQYSKVPNIRGEMDVSEAFAEIVMPLLADNMLNLNAAARYADYSGSGGIWAWKTGLDSQITDSVRLRATRSHDVRAGTLSERFDQTGGAASVQDPFNGNVQTNIFRTSGGDPSIRPEEADTITAGVIWQPQNVMGLSMSLDWFEVDLADAISELSPQQVLDQCYAGDISLCGRVHRLVPGDDTSPINLIQANVLNVARANVSGTDFEVSYRREIDLFGGGETIGIRLLSTHLTENSTQGFQSPVIDRAGQTFLFEYPTDKITANVSYGRGPFSAFLQWRWIDEGIRDMLDTEGVDIDDTSIDSIAYFDLNLRYEMEMDDGGTWEIYGNVQNLTDEDPPVTASFGFFGATANQTNSGLYDVLGRRYVIGARFNF